MIGPGMCHDESFVRASEVAAKLPLYFGYSLRRAMQTPFIIQSASSRLTATVLFSMLSIPLPLDLHPIPR